MNEIICPHCMKAFKVDEAGYANILKQVKDHIFEEELQTRLALAENEKVSAVKLAEANVKNFFQAQLAKKDLELSDLKSQNEIALSEKLRVRDTEITQLKAKIDSVEIEKKLAVTEAIQKIEKERDDIANTLRTKELEKQ